MSSSYLKLKDDVDFRAPILLTHLTGAEDAGDAGELVVKQLLTSLPSTRVATFDYDHLLDYRSNRPRVRVKDGKVVEVQTPGIALDLVIEDGGTPILILHGSEPDLGWKGFAKDVQKIAQDAGVEIAVSVMGIPSNIPHTRPPLVHTQYVNADEPMGLEDGELPDFEFPSSADTYLQYALSKVGIDGVTFIATVPYYLARMTNPLATIALLDHMRSMLELNLPTGNADLGVELIKEYLKGVFDEDQEKAELLGHMEHMYDETIGDGDDKIARILERSQQPLDEEQISEITADFDMDGLTKDIQNFISRTSIHSGEEPESKPTRPKPRHRAPLPWENDD
ncbi:MAG: PAC2 family protein [Actinomycetaceae bacterium]|nr:PAC2 family protein [Actinomycetaceae bacterium]